MQLALAGDRLRRRTLAFVVGSLALGVLALSAGGASAGHGTAAFKTVCCFKVKVDAEGMYSLSYDNARIRGQYRVEWEWSARAIDWLYDFQGGHWALLNTPPQPGASSRALLAGGFRESDGIENFQIHGSQSWEADAPHCESGQGAFYNTALEKATRSDAGNIRYVVGSQGAEVWAHDLDRWRELCHGPATSSGFAGFPQTHWGFAKLSVPPLAKLRAGDTGGGWLTTTCNLSDYQTINDRETKAFFVVRIQIRYFPASQLAAATNGLRKLVDTGEGAAESVLAQYRDLFFGDNALRGPWPSLLPPDGCHRPN